MNFHSLLTTVMELVESRNRKPSNVPLENLDVLDINYEDVLEYYRYKTINEQGNHQEPSEGN